uniref:G_PROTEIN_RECEP_F1_2 domain-containing protein n=1 Tax=Panagrellus redivivus TaxID=6233 RepID=A0A7E4VR17_PANRE
MSTTTPEPPPSDPISEDDFQCGAKNEGYDDARFALVTYGGTPIAICGLIFNLILVRTFSRSQHLRTPTFYLFLLAIFDSLICVIYIPFFTVDAIAIYYADEKLHHLWHSYVLILYGTSRVVQCASTYMMVCATIERFVVVANIRRLSFLSTEIGRYAFSILTLCVIFVLRLPAFFDYKIVFLKECPSFEDYTFAPLLMEYENYQMFNFYVNSIVQIIVPFILLLSLNLTIIALTKKKIYSKFGLGYFAEMPQIATLLRKESINTNQKHRTELRYATRTMVLIVFTYLFCNSFSMFVTVMENVFKDNRLMFNEDGSSTQFYTYTADLVSILAVINCFLRIFIYFFCNPQFRAQTLNNFSKLCTQMRKFLNCKQACTIETSIEKKSSDNLVSAGSRDDQLVTDNGRQGQIVSANVTYGQTSMNTCYL